MDLKNEKSAIHVARLTIHEVDVRNYPSFSDKLVEDSAFAIMGYSGSLSAKGADAGRQKKARQKELLEEKKDGGYL